MNIKNKDSVRNLEADFFYSGFMAHIFLCVFFINQTGLNMQLTLIENPDNTKIVLYKLARIVYAETLAQSLHLVEAFSSMIYNIHIKQDKSFEDIANDANVFEVLNDKSKRNQFLNINAKDKKFQMCLRVVQRMMNGNLRDFVFGATKFHHTDVMPQWAVSRGYIAEIGDILFYL